MANQVKTTPDSFANDFVKLCKSYTDDVVEAIFDDTNNIAEKGVEELKQTNQPPASSLGTAKPSSRRLWNRYTKGWKVKTKGGNDYDEFIHCTIHNKTHYMLTHLLENGHATHDGNTTRAFKHIEPISDECTKKLENDIPKIIKKGGKL